MGKGKSIGIGIGAGIGVIIVVGFFVFGFASVAIFEQVDPDDIGKLEELKGLETKFANEWGDLDTLMEKQRRGKITPNQECQTIANLMNRNISDDHLYAFWHYAFLQECT